MPWKVTNVMDQRINFVVRAIQERESFTALCREFDISRQTGYRWVRRYREVGSFSRLHERSRRPRNSPNRTSDVVERRVIELRLLYGWGAKKLHVLLAGEGLELSIRTINRIIDRHGLVDPKDSHSPATKRFEREAPNQLWQMDFKGDFDVQEGRCYPLSILDDHSRYLIGLYALPGQRAEPVHDCLVTCFRAFGVPEAMLMDHGTPWWSTTNSWGLTWLSVSLIKQGIRLYNGRFRHPQTQGKVERFHRTLQESFRHHGRPDTLGGCVEMFSGFRYQYNHVRPHEALHMDVPAERYYPSPRPYDPNPPEWEYPDSFLKLRVNSQGMLTYNKTRYFVSESLAGEIVGVQEVSEILLVSYRHMHVREINTRTKRTRALLRPMTDKV